MLAIYVHKMAQLFIVYYSVRANIVASVETELHKNRDKQ